MYRYFFIAKNNMKKQKGDMITFFIMTFLSAFMIFVCLNLLTGTFRVIDTNKEAINGADALILKQEEPVSDFKLKELIQSNENFAGYEENKYLAGSAKYRKKGAKNWADYWFNFESYEEESSENLSDDPADDEFDSITDKDIADTDVYEEDDLVQDIENMAEASETVPS